MHSEKENIKKYILLTPVLGLVLKYTKNILATQLALPFAWPAHNQHIGH